MVSSSGNCLPRRGPTVWVKGKGACLCLHRFACKQLVVNAERGSSGFEVTMDGWVMCVHMRAYAWCLQECDEWVLVVSVCSWGELLWEMRFHKWLWKHMLSWSLPVYVSYSHITINRTCVVQPSSGELVAATFTFRCQPAVHMASNSSWRCAGKYPFHSTIGLWFLNGTLFLACDKHEHPLSTAGICMPVQNRVLLFIPVHSMSGRAGAVYTWQPLSFNDIAETINST